MTKKFTLVAFAVWVAIMLGSCTKEEVIPNNQPPPDSTINNVIKENYVNRLYISILGRECTDAEFTESYTILNQNNLSVDSRKQVINLIAAKPGYYERIFSTANADYLNSTDSIDYVGQIYTYQLALQNQAYQQYWPLLQAELNKLQTFLGSVNDMKNGVITVVGFHKRCVYNYKYDEINMGSLNYVASTYQNFFFRYPTQSELEQGIKCVDGFPATVFMQTAENKEQYIDLFFASPNYFEGQVRGLFNRYLFREPTSAEQTYYTERYMNSLDYKELQRDILSLDEFVGIE